MSTPGNSGAPPTGEAATITDLLKTAKTVAVIGLSSKGHRASFGVAEHLKSAGYCIIPVNPNESEVLGEKAYARLEDVPGRVDIVDIFRRPEYVPEIVEAAIRIGARAVWMQLGVINYQAAARARSAELFVVMDRCMSQELYKRGR